MYIAQFTTLFDNFQCQVVYLKRWRVFRGFRVVLYFTILGNRRVAKTNQSPP